MFEPDEMGLTSEAAEGYEEYFVPAIFHQWPPVLIEQAELADGDDLLDIGCGTGVLSREAISIVGETGSVTGFDLSESMLGVARRKAPQAKFHQGNVMSLPFEDASFDVVTSSFMLMFVPDQVKAVREMWRVLRPGGRLVLSVWESLDNNPVYAQLVAIAKHRINEESGNSLAMPFALGNEGKLKSILSDAGLDSALTESHSGRARFPSLEDFVVTEFKAWVLGDGVDDEKIDLVVVDAKIKLDNYTAEGDDNSMDFPFDAIVAKAKK